MPLRGCLASIRASSASMAGEKVVLGAAGSDAWRIVACSGAVEASSEAMREAIDADSAGVGEASMSGNRQPPHDALGSVGNVHGRES